MLGKALDNIRGAVRAGTSLMRRTCGCIRSTAEQLQISAILSKYHAHEKIAVVLAEWSLVTLYHLRPDTVCE